ncbi:sensor histidine kinase [Sneathiella sp.]|uniref:sensor histidine kinase n=1 Tax=Sneathiella sp. TaxID=1964365 RepID=UPI0035655EC3
MGIASIPGFLWWRRKRLYKVGKGYHLIIIGTTIIALAFSIEYAKDVIFGFMPSGAQIIPGAFQLEVITGVALYLPGSLLVAWGLSSYLPAVGRLNAEITLRQQTEQQLLQAKADADVASAAKSQFLANMSHELRTPLNAILGFSDILKNQTFGSIGMPVYQEYAEDIHSSGTHLLDLINGILDVAKIEAGRFQLTETVVDVKSSIGICVNMSALMAKDAGIELVVEAENDLPCIYADSIRLRQIISNLLSNAIKFTNPGGKVTISTDINQRGELFISVQDTGIGIAADDIENVLTKFGQVPDKQFRNAHGTGLGLSLVQLIVSEHEGIFEFSSELDVGTTATINFPFSRLRPRPISQVTANSDARMVAKKA